MLMNSTSFRLILRGTNYIKIKRMKIKYKKDVFNCLKKFFLKAN